MNKYRIFETDKFIKDIQRFQGKILLSIKNKLKTYVYPQLRENPYFGINIKKLQNYEPPTWRYRIANYRVFYSIDKENNIVNILTIDHRKDAY